MQIPNVAIVDDDDVLMMLGLIVDQADAPMETMKNPELACAKVAASRKGKANMDSI